MTRDSMLAAPLLTGHGADAQRASAAELRANFQRFTVMFAVVMGVVTTPLVISTSVLDSFAGYIGNAFMFLLSILSSFVLAAPVVSKFGPRRALLCAILLYCVYAGVFALAILVTSDRALEQLWLFTFGSCCAGLAAGTLWTSQGVYFSVTVELLRKAEDTSSEQVSAELAGSFAFAYLVVENSAKLLWGVLSYAGFDSLHIACFYTAIGVGGLAGMTRVLDIRLEDEAKTAHPVRSVFCSDKLLATAGLWRKPAVFLLAGPNLTFGFSAAFMNGYINAQYTKPQLGSFAVLFLSAFTALVAAAFAKLFAFLGGRVGKELVIFIGAASFAGIPISFFALGCCENWGSALAALYFLQGIGRAVYESTNRGIFRDFFPDHPDAAFANCMLQSSSAFAACFFLSSFLHGDLLAKIALTLAVATPIALRLATVIHSGGSA